MKVNGNKDSSTVVNKNRVDTVWTKLVKTAQFS